MKKRQSNVPVFLIYAGIIHAIGLALLLPMLITLPGPGRDEAPESAAIDVEIIPAAPLAGKIEPDGEQTSALPSGGASSGEAAGAKPDGARAGVAAVDTEARPEEAPDAALPEDADAKNTGAQIKDTTEPSKPAKASTAKPAKKAVAVRRSPAGRRAARKDAKIAPFNGALTGLFSPGAPAKRR